MASGIIHTHTHSELLWTNPSPSANFSAQTVPLELSAYKYIIIVIRATTGRDILYANVCTVGAETYKQRLFCPDYQIRTRYCTVTSSGVVFEDGQYYNTYGNSVASTSSSQAIPYKIYGVG